MPKNILCSITYYKQISHFLLLETQKLKNFTDTTHAFVLMDDIYKTVKNLITWPHTFTKFKGIQPASQLRKLVSSKRT